MSAQQAIDLMRQAQEAVNAGDRGRADQLAQQAYTAAQGAGRNAAQVAAAVVSHADSWGPVAPPPVEQDDVWSPDDPNSPSNVQAQADRAAAAREAAAAQAAREMDAAREAQRQQNAIGAIRGVLEQMNLMPLYDRVVNFIKEGYDADTVMVLIRTTPEYKQRFPAMDALAAKGRAISEAEYINYETVASGLERRYGLPTGMLMGNVTTLLTNEVSAAELNDRVMLASAAAIEAPQDLRNTFQQYYGISTGGLAAYFLDPDIATPLLERQYAASVIGTEAQRQGIGIDAFSAENLQQLGITQEQARQGFGTVAGAMPLTEGRGDVVSQNQLISGVLAGNQQAGADIERAAQSRVGRFQRGGEFLQTQQGAVGLGTAQTT